MERFGLNDLREKFLQFYERKGHQRLPSFPLIPQGDNSLLLINSGMAPMKKYFTGEVTPPSKRVATCQKCVRTPDIDNVGKTARHGTFFEMLGNFSFGDYFKREAITWAWEFFTQEIGLPKERIYVTVYEEDDEAFDIWTKEVGLTPDHVLRMGKADNFWEHGSGPCGPCSELHFDRGKQYGCGKPDCGPACECDRYVEVWNLVFTQFEHDGNGRYTRLEHPNIDTGMGLERLACVVQGADNIFEIDTMRHIMDKAAEIAGISYHDDAKKDVSLRVVTDHIRSTTMLIGDGVMPANEGRGYVLRRLLRRAARHGRLLGIERPFLAEVCDAVIHANEAVYPNLKEKRDFIHKVIAMEEESFARTIDTGLQLLRDKIGGARNGVLSGADAFLLYDTYGFPIDLTREILQEQGMTVDEDAFESLMREQRQRARCARKDAGADAWKNVQTLPVDLPETIFTGYEALAAEHARILSILVDGEPADELNPACEATLVLDRTPFYAEGGGQVGDVGLILSESGTFTVTNTTKRNGVFLHAGSLTQGARLRPGDMVRALVDPPTREATMRNHTAAHLLQAALRKTLGSHVEQAGQLVNAQEVRFDFSHFSALTAEERNCVEHMVNEAILAASPVTSVEMSLEEAKKLGAMALFGEKYGDVVRVVRAGEYSLELCGGTHADNTGRLGLFHITAETSVAAGVRRIQAVTGFHVLDYLARQTELLQRTAQAFKLGNLEELPARAIQITADLKAREKALEQANAALSARKAQDIFANVREVAGLSVVTAVLDEIQPSDLRALCDEAKGKGGSMVAVLAGVQKARGTVSFAAACGKDAIAHGAHAGNLVREVAKLAGGSGGGRPDSAMAGGKQPELVETALAAVDGLLESMVK